jgi:23S rRNA (adenine2503-C2)-methyltransferase
VEAEKPLFFDLTLDELIGQLTALGAEPYRARQLWQGIYSRLIADVEQIYTLPASLRQSLQGAFRFESLQEIASVSSRDGETEKKLYQLKDGVAIEAVLMRYDRRRTACISTQAGCAMGCVFCATGQMGFLANLSAGQIVEQVLLIARRLKLESDRLTNVVIMGMGEPFHNYDATLRAIEILNDPDGFNFGARRFTISTVGLVPMIERFTRLGSQINLAISLHAATDALRESLLPVNRRYPLKALMDACREYVERTKRRITFEWALIEGVNDTPAQAEALAGWVRGMNCHVNLIPLNPTRGYGGQASRDENVDRFQQLLASRGISATVRVRRGIDIQAGCGQLATEDSAHTAQ